MIHTIRILFRLLMGLTGISEAVLGLAIVFFATDLQVYLEPDLLDEPLYLRIIGMMDFWIGSLYVLIAIDPVRHTHLNKSTSFLRLGLSAVFFVEGFWLLQRGDLRLMYQLMGAFDFSLFLIQVFSYKKKFNSCKGGTHEFWKLSK